MISCFVIYDPKVDFTVVDTKKGNNEVTCLGQGARGVYTKLWRMEEFVQVVVPL